MFFIHSRWEVCNLSRAESMSGLSRSSSRSPDLGWNPIAIIDRPPPLSRSIQRQTSSRNGSWGYTRQDRLLISLSPSALASMGSPPLSSPANGAPCHPVPLCRSGDRFIIITKCSICVWLREWEMSSVAKKNLSILLGGSMYSNRVGSSGYARCLVCMLLVHADYHKKSLRMRR